MSNKKNRRRFRWIISISIWTFILAILFGFVAQYSLTAIQSISISFIILIIVVMIGIVFDLIGTAAAAADIAPLNAKAARKTEGAKKGVYLVKHADQVANFCNDVAGDISGIVSGTMVALVVIKLAVTFTINQAEFYLGLLLTALVAAITVGGKAWGKTIAINYSTEVILVAGKIIDRLESPLNWLKGLRKSSG